MLAIHGLWSPGRGLGLWAEDTDRAVKSRSQARQAARPHPFVVPADELNELYPGKPDTAMLLLPSLPTAPLDSPELVRISPRPKPTREPVLVAWSVPVVYLGAADALAVLDLFAVNAGDNGGPKHAQDSSHASVARNPVVDAAADIRPGASLHYLGELAAFARELAEAGRVLPSIVEDTGLAENAGFGETGHRDHCSSRWRPVLQGPDISTLQSLIAALPPVCRAETDAPTSLRGQQPADLVSDAVHALVDTVVRERLSTTSLLDAAKPRRGRRPKRLPIAEVWVQALTTADGNFEAAPEEVAELQRALAPWSDFGLGQTGPARATFRLTEAVPSLFDLDQTEFDKAELDKAELDKTESDQSGSRYETEWRLEFWLQSIEDPSLLVPADQVWAGGDGLSRWLDRPDELMLAELGRASTVYAELADALRQARPIMLELDAGGAYHFLADMAAVLEQAGFGVLLPSWWSKRRRLGLAARASTPTDAAVTGGRFGREQLVGFEWQLAIGDEPLTAEELAALAATKAPLVRLRGEWVAVDQEQLRRGLDFLKRKPAKRRTAADIIALAASHPDDLDTPLPVNSVQADGWLGDLLSGTSEQHLQPVEPPDSMLARLRPYQLRGLSWLAFLSQLGLGACLADDMGLGKTVQLLALETYRRAKDPDAGPTLLLCPMSLVGNWQREGVKFAPSLRVYAHHGVGRQHGAGLDAQIADSDLVVTTYATATRDIEDLVGHDWDQVVLDEAQMIKNSLSQASKAVRRLQAGQRIALTGTPMENRLSELWSIMDFLNPGLLGSSDVFRARYAIPVERHGQTEPAERLRRITRPYILRRLKTDAEIIDDLPDKIEIKQYCKLTTEQASLYQSVVDEMMIKIEDSDGIQRRGNVLAAMAKLKQVCNHPAQLLHDRSAVGQRSGKVIRLEELLDEILAEDDKVLCFTQYTEFADLLLPHLAARFDIDPLYLHGGTPKKRRDEMVTHFQSDGGAPIFLLSLRAGGTGLNLTAASHVIHLDRWWNPAVENQATDRAFRIGQKRNVQVRKFICTGTLEEKIDDMIEEKKALSDLVISDGEGWLTEMSTGALRDLFALDQGAVGE